jgi:CRISPR-associated endonuclease/helicase Cas3
VALLSFYQVIRFVTFLLRHPAAQVQRMQDLGFDEFFEKATGNLPFPFQRKFAEAASFPHLVSVPTGLGKTAMAVIGWLWHRFGTNRETKTPRRLVYCLPMRILVEQTAENAHTWINKLTAATVLEGEKPLIHVLMGGENETEWDIHPESVALLIGTQDMLLSRALNRGYAVSRARWPVQFGLLHTDCLWVFDEIQLMGAGLATTAQLAAFRRVLPREDSEATSCHSVWMSATIQRDWIGTVDFAPFLAGTSVLTFEFKEEIAADGLDEKARATLENRWRAKKPLGKTKAVGGDLRGLAEEVLAAHKRGTRTIVVVNTVGRARELFEALKIAGLGKQPEPAGAKDIRGVGHPRFVLLHSRFRLQDREQRMRDALREINPGEPGAIVVSTQVIEAGVDISAMTLFTELAPWASLVQRFGRCNRRGEDNDDARVFWIDLPDSQKQAEKLAPPYDIEDLKDSAEQLKRLKDVGLNELPQIDLPFEHPHVIRRKDLIDLFDTTPDLAGNDLDIDRFVREVENSDVRVFWRDWDQKQSSMPSADQAAPLREELCPAPIGEFKDLAKDQNRKRKVWRWNFLEKIWEPADANRIAPGQVFMAHVSAGGYSSEHGWEPASEILVDALNIKAATKGNTPDANDADHLSQIPVWQTIAEHVEEVCIELEAATKNLAIGDFDAQAMHYAARWHDRGKAHEVFREALPDGAQDQTKLWAKAKGTWKRYGRPHFRHELASALAVLDPRNDGIPDEVRDLVAYLVAAHHGKVRLSIRSLPGEHVPQPRTNSCGSVRRFARGVWDGDELPLTDLGGGVIAPSVVLSLEPMELGLCNEPPFAELPSWADRMQCLLNHHLGPFRLAYLEAIVRAADMRASRKAERRGAITENPEAAAVAGKDPR